MDQIARAASMAGAWWAERLDQKHSDKKAAFAHAIAAHYEAEIRIRIECGVEPFSGLYVDFDPLGELLVLVKAVIDKKCSGKLHSARGILPDRISLDVGPTRLRARERDGEVVEIPVEI